MTTAEQKTCAHIPCTCAVEAGQKYCSESCRDAGSDEAEIALRMRARDMFDKHRRSSLAQPLQNLSNEKRPPTAYGVRFPALRATRVIPG
jgi:predicted nucleic acid-binding Zn ribbon protein